MRQSQSTFHIDALLRRIARRQLGLITSKEAAALGVDKHALARRRASGALVPMFADVMRLGAVLPSQPQRILAASLAVPGSVVAGVSAAIIHQMPVPKALFKTESTPVLSVSSHTVITLVGIQTIRHAVLLPSKPWMTRSLATPAASLILLPRSLEADAVERCLDHCLAHRLVTVTSVLNLIQRVPVRSLTGRRLLLELLADRAGGIGYRSALERKVARWLQTAGLKGWKRNFGVTIPGDTIEVDFGWVQHKVALEVSPFFTHGSRAKQERDAQRRRLLVAQGWRIVEALDADLESQTAFQTIVGSMKLLLNSSSK
jgi:very-short-patch-repair endonuclease